MLTGERGRIDGLTVGAALLLQRGEPGIGGTEGHARATGEPDRDAQLGGKRADPGTGAEHHRPASQMPSDVSISAGSPVDGEDLG